ncbi:MAG: MBL fold metallo-hydrolase [Planctomycetia bacterium]|nr:MBL fold metallo-hydrolase [Planctomycetia bacterium]
MATIDLFRPARSLLVACVESQPFGENTYVVRREGDADCLVIDPGFEPADVIEWIDSHNLEPRAILLTHGHSDHIAGNAALRNRWPELPIWVGRGDAPKLTSPAGNLSAAFGMALVSPPADRLLDDGEVVRVAGLDIDVREIPGHSIGHVVFVIGGSEPPVVFGGDVLFREGVGRTDFPDGDFARLAAGIRRHLYSLPDDTIVYPGHGGPTTVGHEKRHNPFVAGVQDGN